MAKPKESPNSTWSMRRLRNYECAWCSQRLNEAKRGNCGAIYRDHSFECHWAKVLRNAVTETGELK